MNNEQFLILDKFSKAYEEAAIKNDIGEFYNELIDGLKNLQRSSKKNSAKYPLLIALSGDLFNALLCIEK